MGVRLGGDRIQVLSLGSGQPVTVSISGTTATSAQLTSVTSDCVRLWATTDCFVRFGGVSVVATTSDHPLTAKVPEVFQLDGNLYIAAITSSASGTLFISKMQ